MDFVLNGSKRTYTGDEELPLLKYLREHEGITSPKDGCAPQAACGCCVVQLNGRGVLSCVIPMKKVADGEVITTEGLGEFRQKNFANAFVEKGGVQCGFCIPGFVMQANSLINQNPNPTRDDVVNALTPNLCRCTGYKKIVDAILYAAEAIRENREIPAPKTNGKVGQRQPKYGADQIVLGQSRFTGDMMFDGMVYGALKFSDHPRAVVKRINTAELEKLPGVLKLFTAKDVPGEIHTGLIVADWPLMIAEGQTTRYVGDVLAGVVAESDDIARAAVKLIEVEYEVLPPLTDPKDALKKESPLVHQKGNLLSETKFNRGEVDKALESSKFVTKGIYETQVIEHGYMEPECAVAGPADDGIVVYSQGQGVFEDREQIAGLLKLPADKVRVIMVPNGGGFGGKEDLSVQGHAALYARLLKKPVKITLTRDESILMHPKRHPLIMEYTLGCDKNGKLTGLKANILGDTGAYASVGMKVLERAAGHATGAYHIPHADIVSRAVYTNNIPCGAMRGFGVNQVTFAIESCIDDLCRQGGFDRWQFRYDNALKPGDVTSSGQVLNEGIGVRKTLLAVKSAFESAAYAGIACGIKNTGIGNGMPDEGKIRIVVEAADRVVVYHGWTEMGQGAYTMAVQFLCEETGIDPSMVEVKVDTASEMYAGMTTASRATSIIGNAMIEAASGFKKDLAGHSLSELVGKKYEGQWVCDWTTKPGSGTKDPVTHYSYSYATQVVTLNEDGQVDTVYAAHDAGRVINPTLFEGQIEGSIHMGLGYALTEDLPMEQGVPKSTRLRKCGILRAKETPKMVVIGVEEPDPHGPYGAKGVGEIGLVPTAGAVANAFFQYDGIRRFKLPLGMMKKKTAGSIKEMETV